MSTNETTTDYIDLTSFMSESNETTASDLITIEITTLRDYVELETCTGLGLTATESPEGVVGTCEEGYLNTGRCCLDQNWIIGLAAGGSSFIIVVLISIIIWLAVSQKRHQGADKKDMGGDGNALQMTGLENPAGPKADNEMSERAEADKVVLINEQITSSLHQQEGESPETTRVSADGKPYTADVLRERPLCNQQRPCDSQLYDDIEQYNGCNGTAEQGEEPKYENTPEDHVQRETKPRVRDVSRAKAPSTVEKTRVDDVRKSIDGIDVKLLDNFQANLDHVDPNIDYKIKRPQFSFN